MSTSTKSTSNSSVPSPAGRTTVFVAAAAACLGITAAFDYASRPAAIEEFGRIGEEFYPEFTDPTLASGLEVHVFDKEEVLPRDFIVTRLPNGRWTIPSHHGYPADAEDQLGKTAASVIGIKRGAMVTRWPADHAQYGVVNPRQDSLKVDEVEGVGKRLILKGEGDAVLVDYIIGDSAGTEQSNEYYVRSPDEDEVYIASLTIDLSTKFSDWIDTDMLHINQSDLVGLTINDYAFEETQRGIAVSKTKTNVLKRNKSSDPWTLDDLNEDTEEVDKDAMRDAANAIADMKIVGVREKQPGLTPDLKLDREAIKSQGDVERMQTDLMSKGFLLQPDETPESLKLIAREGELFASTSDGLTYRMYFGRAFTGTQEELEIGLTADNSGDDSESDNKGEADESGEASDESDDAADGETDKADETRSSQPGRYVFVRVDFSEANLGERPAEPVAPVEPEELKQAAAAEEESEADDVSEGDKEEASDDDEGAGNTEEEDDPLAKIREEYESAKKKYDVDVLTWETDVKEFEKKITDGQEKAEKLNRRFADWYYVIPGETFDKLRLSREDIVKPKEKDEEEESDVEQASDPSDTTETSAKPATEDASTNDAAPEDSKPTEESTPEADVPESEESSEEAASEEASKESPKEPAEPTDPPPTE